MRDTRFRWVDLEGSQFRQVGLQRVRMRGVELVDVDIDGELQNVVINGVDVAPLVEAELERQDPEYARMKPQDADDFRAAWQVLERRWAETVHRARRARPGAAARAGRRRVVVRRDAAAPLLRHRRVGQPGLPRRPRPLVAARPSVHQPSATSHGPMTRTCAPRSTRSWRCAPTGRRPYAGCSPTSPTSGSRSTRRPVEGAGWPPADNYSGGRGAVGRRQRGVAPPALRRTRPRRPGRDIAGPRRRPG